MHNPASNNKRGVEWSEAYLLLHEHGMSKAYDGC